MNNIPTPNEAKALEQLKAVQAGTAAVQEQRAAEQAKDKNKPRVIATIINLILTFGLGFIIAIYAFVAGGAQDFSIVAFFLSFVIAFEIVGFWIPGIMHTKCLLVKLKKVWFILVIAFLPCLAIILIVISVGGTVFFFIDLVLLIMKKPLYYPWEK